MPVAHSLYNEVAKVTVVDGTCTRCGACAHACPSEILHLTDGRIVVTPESGFGCIACGHCMMVCPNGSITVSGRGVSPDDICSLAPLSARATPDQLTALMQARRSVRHFKDEEVDPQLLRRIIEIATTAPMGIPPWDVGCTLVVGKTKVRELAEQVAKSYESFLKVFKPWMLTLMRPFIAKSTYEQLATFIFPLAQAYVRASREGRDAIFYDAPAVLIFHHSPLADAVDAGIACTYAMLAAESLGLGSTMIGGAPPFIQRNKKLRAELGIPTGNKVSLALIVGHSAITFRHAIKRNFSHVNTIV